jgi:hypothetical protein
MRINSRVNVPEANFGNIRGALESQQQIDLIQARLRSGELTRSEASRMVLKVLEDFLGSSPRSSQG